MKQQKILILSVLTVLVIAFAAYYSQSQAPKTKIEKEKLFPDLTNKINDVSHIEIKGSDGRTVVLQKQEKQWVVQSADNYPALFDKIKDTVISLANLKIVATKTDNPKRYPELGVEGIEAQDSQSKLLTLSDNTGNILATLIVGKPKKGKANDTRPNLYVRQADEKNALLVAGYLKISTKNTAWYKRHIIHIPASRIQTIDISKSDGSHLKLHKSSVGETDFKLEQGQTDAPSVLQNKLATFFEDINVDGIHAVSDFGFPEDTTITVFKTFNGLIITVKSILQDDKAFVHFSFTTDEAIINIAEKSVTENESEETVNVTKESQLWNDFLSQWVYEIPDFKYETLNIPVASPDE